MSGAYTLLFDRGVSGGAVTPDRVEHLQKWNFGRGVLNETLTLHRFKELLANYSRDEALSAGRMLRPLVNPALIGGRFEILYQQCITARGQRGTPGSWHAEKMRFVQSLMKPMLYPQENFPSSRRFRERQISAAPDRDSPRQQ